MNTTKTVVILPRIIHVVDPGGTSKTHIQTASDSGKLGVYPTTEAIYQQVLGSVSGSDQQFRNLGLRGLTNVKFRGHLDESGKLLALDIVPKRAFVRGAAPTSYGRALGEGFEMVWNEALQGFDVSKGCYAGMDEKTLFGLIDELRGYAWKGRKSVILREHKVERNGEVYTVRPLATKLTFSDAR